MFGSRSTDDADAALTRTNGWTVPRRTFLSGVGTAVGMGSLTGSGRAAPNGTSPRVPEATYYVYRTNDRYLVANSPIAGIEFNEPADRNAEAAFQYAFDNLPESGGTVVASPDTFRFGGPATLGTGTTLVGSDGTRFVGSTTGQRDDPLPSDAQDNPLATGHDIVRLRGDNVAVVGIEFDADGAQLDNHAVQADGCSGVYIANNRTLNGFQMALSFTGCDDVTVQGNVVDGPNWYGITARGAPEGSDIDLKQSTNVLVTSNRVSDLKFNNIAVYNVRDFAVSQNVVSEGGHSLIACSPSQGGAIVGNVCRDIDRFGGDPGGEAGIEIEYKRTHITDAVAGTPAETSFDITVAGNHVRNCGVGFISRTVPADLDDVRVDEARRNKRPYSFSVTGNTISACRNAGIRIRSGEDAVLATNTLRRNGTDPESADLVNGSGDEAANIDVNAEYTAGIQRDLNVVRN
ncbi:right-handed parallel beta-helix repeat-containing protein [Halorientalis salina]|uniref:right-handed parallel beta-helix repeat-containing protein n=1 Tax=Halorientalis salina TaxID=2932266 RepID=UPI0010ABFE34|nr:right-handed parallel beta-helix repeat-containing protein [Halorientalis salina]